MTQDESRDPAIENKRSRNKALVGRFSSGFCWGIGYASGFASIIAFAFLVFLWLSGQTAQRQQVTEWMTDFSHIHKGQLFADGFSQDNRSCQRFVKAEKLSPTVIKIWYRDSNGKEDYDTEPGFDDDFHIWPCTSHEVRKFHRDEAFYASLRQQRANMRRYRAFFKGLKPGDEFTVEGQDYSIQCDRYEHIIYHPGMNTLDVIGRGPQPYDTYIDGLERSITRGCAKGATKYLSP